MADDLVGDILARVALELGDEVFTPELSVKIETGVRRTWSGNRVYIPAKPRKRNSMEIVEAYRDGKSIAELSAKYGLTERRIRQIVNVRKK